MLKPIFYIIFLLVAKTSYTQINYTAIIIDKNLNIPLPGILVKTETSTGINFLRTNNQGYIKCGNQTKDSINIVAIELRQQVLDTSFLLSSHNNNKLDTLWANLDYLSYKYGYNKYAAYLHIEEENIRLLLPGGLIGTPIEPTDTIFENKYNIKYLSRGCARLLTDNEKEYNQAVFIYLSLIYGNKWRDEVRKDVIGLPK